MVCYTKDAFRIITSSRGTIFYTAESMSILGFLFFSDTRVLGYFGLVQLILSNFYFIFSLVDVVDFAHLVVSVDKHKYMFPRAMNQETQIIF